MLFVAVIACGPMPHPHQPLDVAGASSIADHLDERVAYGGIWFPDAGCHKEFRVRRVIAAGEHAALARCLASLHLAPADRHEEGFDLFTYEPGLEIEMLDIGDITWIGYIGSVAQTPTAALPTVTQAAFESLRRGGDPLPADVHAWFEVCINGSGEVTGVHPMEIDSDAALDELGKTIRAWTFRPFRLGGAAWPVCSWIENGKPPAGATDDAGEVPIAPLDDGAVGPLRERIAGETNIQPDDVTKNELANAHQPGLVLTIRYCIDPAGKVAKASVYTSSAVDAYDRRALDAVRGWRFEPAPRETCDSLTLIYRQQ